MTFAEFCKLSEEAVNEVEKSDLAKIEDEEKGSEKEEKEPKADDKKSEEKEEISKFEKDILALCKDTIEVEDEDAEEKLLGMIAKFKASIYKAFEPEESEEEEKEIKEALTTRVGKRESVVFVDSALSSDFKIYAYEIDDLVVGELGDFSKDVVFETDIETFKKYVKDLAEKVKSLKAE